MSEQQTPDADIPDDDSEDLYCSGPRCADCTRPGPDDPYGETDCCEATCGYCPRVAAHDHCRLAPGAYEDSKYCDQHGDGILLPLSPTAARAYDILRRA